MSEFVWNPELPEGAVTAAELQTTALSTPAVSILVAQPQTRRGLREQRERALQQQAEQKASQEHDDLIQLLEAAESAAELMGAEPTGAEPMVAEPMLTQSAAAQPARSRPRNSGRKPAPWVTKVAERASKRSNAKRPANRGSAASVWPVLASGRKVNARAVLAKLMSFGAMAGVAAILVATSVPANAFYAEPAQLAEQSAEQSAEKSEVQSLDVQSTEAATAQASARDEYTVVSLAEQLRKQYGNQVFSFTNNPNGTIQWPFATSVPISSGFGPRNACSYCSSNHLGLDFVPGAGAPIQSIADGVVNDVIVSGSGFGVHVIVDHVINGQNVRAVYAHMQWGSPGVARGQSITVGQYIGAVGSTGASTGAHLHFEVHVDGTPIDPFTWLKANAN